MRKVALKPGSSKQGKAFRADSGSNCVAARTLLKNKGIAYANITLQGNKTSLIHLLHQWSLAVKIIQESAPSLHSVSVLVRVWAVVETTVGVWEVAAKVQCQKTALAHLEVTGELNGNLLSRFVLQYSHILGLAITELGERRPSMNSAIIILTSWKKKNDDPRLSWDSLLAYLECSFGNIHIGAVKHNPVGVVSNKHADDDTARESSLGEVRVEGEVVAERPYALRQPEMRPWKQFSVSGHRVDGLQGRSVVLLTAASLQKGEGLGKQQRKITIIISNKVNRINKDNKQFSFWKIMHLMTYLSWCNALNYQLMQMIMSKAKRAWRTGDKWKTIVLVVYL